MANTSPKWYHVSLSFGTALTPIETPAIFVPRDSSPGLVGRRGSRSTQRDQQATTWDWSPGIFWREMPSLIMPTSIWQSRCHVSTHCAYMLAPSQLAQFILITHFTCFTVFMLCIAVSLWDVLDEALSSVEAGPEIRALWAQISGKLWKDPRNMWPS